MTTTNRQTLEGCRKRQARQERDARRELTRIASALEEARPLSGMTATPGANDRVTERAQEVASQWLAAHPGVARKAQKADQATDLSVFLCRLAEEAIRDLAAPEGGRQVPGGPTPPENLPPGT